MTKLWWFFKLLWHHILFGSNTRMGASSEHLIFYIFTKLVYPSFELVSYTFLFFSSNSKTVSVLSMSVCFHIKTLCQGQGKLNILSWLFLRYLQQNVDDVIQLGPRCVASRFAGWGRGISGGSSGRPSMDEETQQPSTPAYRLQADQQALLFLLFPTFWSRVPFH